MNNNDVDEKIDQILDNNAIELVDYFDLNTGQEGKVTKVKPEAKLAIKEMIEQAQREVLEEIISTKVDDRIDKRFKEGYLFAKAYPEALLQRMKWGATFKGAQLSNKEK